MLKRIDNYFFPTCENSTWDKESKSNGYWAALGVVFFVLFVYGLIL